MPEHSKTDQWKTVRVPASSANLGPGFDALGLALQVHLVCRFRAAATLEIRAQGRDARLISTGEDNLIWQTVQRVAAETGREAPPIELEITNNIPLGKGLGSSAAALTAGVVIANRVLDLHWDTHRIINMAAEIEGHPDNVAACALGSIVASAIDSEGVARAIRMDLHPLYNVAVVVPDFELPTSESRRVLPSGYSRQDTIFNVQRSALLLVALATGATHVFPTALEDRLHQPYRAPLVPGLSEILALRESGLLGCALSGAGPSILVFHQRGREDVCASVQKIFERHGHGSEVLCSAIDTYGYFLD